jgi:RND family efflux transporter MFP subunit
MRMSFSFIVVAIVACAHPHETTPLARVDAPTEIVSTTELPMTRSVAGTVRAATVSPLAAKVMGNVVAVHVREGDRVRAGQLLVEIDDREARTQSDRARAGRDAVERAIDGAGAGVAAAEANAALAATNLKRFAALRERGSVSVAELDDARAKSTVAAAELDRARRGREQLVAQRAEASAGAAQAGIFADYTRVRAPIDGIVTARFVDPGAQAAPGMPLLTVEDDRIARVETSAPEDLAVREGDAVAIEAAGKRIAARVTRVVAALDAASRSAIVKIDLPPGAGLRSGTFANVLFTSGARRAVAIPAAALQTRGALASVFVVGRDGVARLRLVTAGDVAGDRIEILSGLDAGETIVTSLQKITDGVRVR